MPITQVNSDVIDQNAVFVSGTRIGFQQTAAPTGWTKDTTAAMNDSIMRIVTGSAGNGGSNAFSSYNGVTSVGATTLTTTQIPSHSHTVSVSSGGSIGSQGLANNSAGGTTNLTSSSQGGGGSHTHSTSRDIKYYDFIIATKN